MEMPAEDSRVTMGNQTEKKHRFHLKMPQKGRKHSVKKRIAYTFIATMAATLLNHRPDLTSFSGPFISGIKNTFWQRAFRN